MRKLPLYRRKPIPTMSDKEKVRRRSRTQVYALVSRRARGMCEAPECLTRQDPLEPHHAFGRGTKPGIDTNLCEIPEAILGICTACHQRAHHEGKLEALGRTAVLKIIGKLSDDHGVSFQNLFPSGTYTNYVEAAQLLTQWGQENDYAWNAI